MDEIVIQNSRHQDILELLAIDNTLSVKELANKLGVSLVTVRRDLDILQKYNRVKKFHGSVSINKNDTPQMLFNLSLEVNIKEKKAIARVASSIIPENSVISVDASSTAYYIADYLTQISSLKVITYSLLAAIKFSANPHISVFQLGGSINTQSACAIDSNAVEACNRFHSDIAFFSNHAFHSQQGCFDSITSIEVKNALINISKRAVLLVDSSKFEKTAMCLSVPLNRIQTIITDENVPERAVANIIDKGIELYIAKIEDGSILKHYNPITDVC